MEEGSSSSVDVIEGLTSASPPEVKAALLRNYLAVQYAFIQFLSEHLADCRKSVGGDLDDVMLVAVLGQRLLASRLDPQQGTADGTDRDWMSALRIADVTGIPRETVRRKLAGLADRGWIANSPGQGWRLVSEGGVAKARVDLEGLDARALDRLARLFTAIQRVLRAEPPTKADPASAP